MLLTIFTPTYNRAHLLKRLYASLCEQACNDFEWLVVDDGSTDETEQVMSEFISKADFPIKYIKQCNGGKHTAYNTALQHARGDFFFTVDSDDWVPVAGISEIKQFISDCTEVDGKDIAGILALKAYVDGSVISKKFSTPDVVNTLYDLEHSGNRGERSIVLKTSVAKSFPFPVIKGERFVTESVVYDQIGQHYKFVVTNQIFTICEYQSQGLSSNPKRLMYYNPGGYAWYFAQRAEATTEFKELVRYMIQYNAFKTLYKGCDKLPQIHRSRFLQQLTKPLGWIAAKHYKSFAD